VKKIKTAIWLTSATLVTIAANTAGAQNAGAQNIERPILTAEQCQPLSAENAEICCIASNRRLLLTAGELDQCPPLTTASIRAVLEGSADGVIPPSPDVVTVPVDGNDQPSLSPGTNVVTVPIDGNDQPSPTPGTNVGTAPIDRPDQPSEEPGEEPGDDTTNVNSGAGNAGETGSGEHASTDADPGNSAGNNNSPDSPPGQN